MGWLTNCDDDGLAAGENLAVLGSELIQFGRVTSLGAGEFRLMHLLRGRAGTEWASASHVAGEPFCLIEPASVQSVTMPSWSIGAEIDVASADARASITFAGESLRPPTPVNLSAILQPNADLLLNWTRRSRMGFAWIDGVDAPLGELREQYQVDVTGSAGTMEFIVEQPSLTISSADLASLGGGPATIEVRQIGDLAASRPVQLGITLS